MKKKNSIFVFFVFMFLSCGILKAQNENVVKAKELWEKVIAAKGGREHLYSVQNLVVSSNSSSPYDKKEFRNSRYVDFYIMPDKWWGWIDERPGFPLEVRQYDFGQQIGYEVNEGQNGGGIIESRNNSEFGKQSEYKLFDSGLVCIIRPEKSQDIAKRNIEVMKDSSHFNNNVKTKFFENQLLYLMETKWFQPKIETLRVEKLNSSKVDVIEVSFGKEKIEYFIDNKTNLPNRIKFKTWFDETKSYYEDSYHLENYSEVEGVMFPQIVRRGKKTDTKTTYLVNVKYNEKLFDKPPNIKLGLDAWMPKNDK